MNMNELMLYGAVAGIALIIIAYQDWRTSVKFALIFVLFEGAVRKWIFPGASDLVYFIKDVLLVGAYLRFFKEQTLPQRFQWPAIPIDGLKLCLLLLIPFAFHPNIGSILAALLGLKAYLFYIPLVVIIPKLFDSQEDFVQHVYYYVLLSVPICLLGILQSRSDAFSVLNTYAAGGTQWGASRIGSSELVRITGTFSYLSGHVVFVVVMYALSMTLLCIERFRYRWVIAAVVLPLLVANAFMSGARAALFTLAFLTVGFMLGSGAARESGARRSAVLIIGAVLVAGFVVRSHFSNVVEASVARMQNSPDTVYGRIVELPMHQIALAYERGGMFGAGMGITNPAVQSLRRRLNLPDPTYDPGRYDNELGQVMAELGILGFGLWYIFRAATIWITLRVYLNSLDSPLAPFLLSALLVLVPFMLMSLILNHVACVLVWGLVGIALASLEWTAAPDSIDQQSGWQLSNQLPATV